jgi:hypothetical protein
VVGFRRIDRVIWIGTRVARFYLVQNTKKGENIYKYLKYTKYKCFDHFCAQKWVIC